MSRLLCSGAAISAVLTVCACSPVSPCGLDLPPGGDTSDPSDSASSTDDPPGDPADDPSDDTSDDPVDTGPAWPTSIDLRYATVRNSPPDIATWAETARITAIDFDTNGVLIEFTKRDGEGSWPDVPFMTPGEDLQYTLWIVLQVEGHWYTSGCIQYWRGLDRNGGPPTGFAENWYYDSNRWAPMTGVQPAEGDPVGFFVSAGNARTVTDGSGSIVYERSNVVVVPFPSDEGARITY